jgi:hypothetical protein
MNAAALVSRGSHAPPGSDDNFALLRQRLCAFLEREGAFEKIHHRSTGTTLGAHLIGTFDLLRDARCFADVCAAGALHSIYGTFIYRSATVLPTQQRRDAVAAAFGSRAEHLAYLFHASQRPVDLERGQLICRADAADFTWSERDLRDLRLIEAANRIDQGCAFDTLPVVHKVWLEQMQFARAHRAVELQPRRVPSSGDRQHPVLHLSCRGNHLSVPLPILPNDPRLSRWLASCAENAEASAASVKSSSALRLPDAFVIASELKFGMPPVGFEMLNNYRNSACCGVDGGAGSAADDEDAHGLLRCLPCVYRCTRSSPASSSCVRLAIEPAHRITCSHSSVPLPPISLELLRAGDESAAASLAERLSSSGWAIVRAGVDVASAMAAAYAALLTLKALAPVSDACDHISKHHFDDGRYVGLSHDKGRIILNWREGCEAASSSVTELDNCTTRQRGEGDNDTGDGFWRWPAGAEAQHRDLTTAHQICSRAAEDVLFAVLGHLPRHPETSAAALLRPALTVALPAADRAAELLQDPREQAYGSSVQRFLVTRDKPPQSAATSFSSGQHADMGILTLSPLSTHPALEIVDCATGSVIHAEAGLSASLGDCVLLAGETLAFLTGGAVKAPIHRVPWVERQPGSPPRLSAPFFLRAHPAARLRDPTATLNLSCRELMEMHVLSFRPWRLRAFDARNVGDW